MSAIGYRLRIDLPRSARFVLVAGVLGGLVAGTVVATGIGGRRNATAFDRLTRESNAATVLINPTLGVSTKLTTTAVRGLPDVTDAGLIDGLLMLLENSHGQPDLTDTNNQEIFGLADDHALRTVERPKLLEGRVPAPDDSSGIFVNRLMAERHHLHAGSELRLHPVTFGSGGAFTIHPAVVATVRGVGEISSDIVAADGQDPSRLFLPPGFTRAHPSGTVYEGMLVKLDSGPSGIAAFERALAARFPGEAFDYQTLPTIAATVHRATVPGTVALVFFAVVLGVTALIGTSQALGRHLRARSDDLAALRAMGMSGPQLVAGQLGVVAVFAAVAAVVTIPTAIALSGRFPIGPGARAEPHPGLHADGLGLVIGAAATFVAVVAASAPGVVALVRRALTSNHAPQRPSPVVGALTSRLGAARSIGVRAALEPNRKRAAAPTRALLAGTALGLAALIGALVFGANLQRLVHSPTRYGWNWDATVSISLDSVAPNDPTAVASRALQQHLADAGWASGVSRIEYGRLVVDSRPVPAIGITSLRGDLGLTMIAGRAPRTDTEIALGLRTLRTMHRKIGDTVAVQRRGGGTTTMRIVGTPALPDGGNHSGADNIELGAGGLVTETAIRADAGNADPTQLTLLVAYRQPSTGSRSLDAALLPDAKYFDASQWEQTRSAQRPDDIVGISYVRQVPLELSYVLAALALAILIDVLTVSLRARRRELAVLKTLGLVRRDLLAASLWQATTIALAAVVLAGVVGTVAGRLAWLAVAHQVGVVADATTPIVPLVVVAIAALVAANLIALGPGLAASRTSVSRSLRIE